MTKSASRRVAACALLAIASSPAGAEDDPDAAPIHYHTAAVDDPVARLQSRLDAGETRLDWHARWGWLPSVLDHLQIPIESQTLVFSKTSLQATKISPSRPRALYFNDNAYIGYVQRGELLEVMAVDPHLGPIFYTLEQQHETPPQFVRDQGDCLACHLSHRTRDVPGLVVRSLYPDERGHPLFSLGEASTDPTTPLEQRHGGWYVTGDVPTDHRGNAVYEEPEAPGDDARRLPVALGDDGDASRYLSEHSDAVALMVLAHQAQMHNAVTRAAYEARRAAAYDAMWGELLEKPDGFVFEVSAKRLDRATNELLDSLLFVGEQPLPGPVIGSSGFADRFQAEGRRDAVGRSLREFDLRTRLFRYSCSYLVDSESFRALPTGILSRVRERLSEVLSGADQSPRFAHLSPSDRRAIAELLRAAESPLAPARTADPSQTHNAVDSES